MMKLFGYAYGTARAVVRYTDDGSVRFFVHYGKRPGGISQELTGDALLNSLMDMKPVDSGGELNADQVRAIQGAVEVLVKDLTVPKNPRRK